MIQDNLVRLEMLGNGVYLAKDVEAEGNIIPHAVCS
jgi:hypothetical protein